MNELINIGLVIASPQAAQAALALVAKSPDAVFHVIAPAEVLTTDWTARFKLLSANHAGPIALQEELPASTFSYLASIDALHVVADVTSERDGDGLELPLSAHRLICLARHYGVPVQVHAQGADPRRVSRRRIGSSSASRRIW